MRMQKDDFKVGMVIYCPSLGVRGVIVKCNPKKAKVRTLEPLEGTRRKRGVNSNSLWSIPYSNLEIAVEKNLDEELMLRSFGEKNDGLKKYFEKKEPIDLEKESPDWYVMIAVCKIWQDLEKSHSGRLPEFKNSNSKTLQKLFSILGRHVSLEEAKEWESSIT